MAPFVSAGAGVPSKNDLVSDGCHRAVGALGAGRVDGPLHHAVGDHVPPVGNAFLVGQGREDDFNAVLLGFE